MCRVDGMRGARMMCRVDGMGGACMMCRVELNDVLSDGMRWECMIVVSDMILGSDTNVDDGTIWTSSDCAER